MTVTDSIKLPFYCRSCREYWEEDQEADAIVHDSDSGDNFMACPFCGKVVPQSKNLRGLYAAWNSGKKPGPKTEEGIRRIKEATAGKQTGAKTPEGKARAKMNAYKHGGRSKHLTIIAPAKFDAYPACGTCPDDIREKCKAKKISWCPVNIGPMIDFVANWQNGDVKELRHHATLAQAQVFNQLQMIIQDLIKNGVSVVDRNKWENANGTGENVFHKANPVLEHLPKLMQVLGFTADQQTMTPKSEKDSEVLEGFLAAGSVNSKPTDIDYMADLKKQNQKILEQLRLASLPKATETTADSSGETDE